MRLLGQYINDYLSSVYQGITGSLLCNQARFIVTSPNNLIVWFLEDRFRNGSEMEACMVEFHFKIINPCSLCVIVPILIPG